ncbi:MAG: ABC transporter permease [Brevinemataceae bacterium]
MKTNNQNYLALYTTPYLIWMSLFFIFPTLLVIFVSFVDNQSWDRIAASIREFYPTLAQSGIKEAFEQLKNTFGQFAFTLAAYQELFEPRVTATLMRTASISFIASLICVILALPTAHFIFRSQYKEYLLLLLILPFWTNFLIRIFSWIKILGNNGLINSLLLSVNIIDKPISLLYNNISVTFISIYICLPFAVIPIFSAIEKFDFSLLEASEDLGASFFQSFLYVYLPGIKGGIASGFLFSFINTFGNYAVARLVGGQNSYMLGNLVVHNATIGRNMPLAAAISTVICLTALMLMLLNSYVMREKK